MGHVEADRRYVGEQAAAAHEDDLGHHGDEVVGLHARDVLDLHAAARLRRKWGEGGAEGDQSKEGGEEARSGLGTRNECRT